MTSAMNNLQSPIEGAKVVITGGAGFIGSTTASILADTNEVVLFDNFWNNALQNSPVQDHPNVTFVKGDVRDLDALHEVIDDEVTHVIHAAAIAGVDTVIENPHLTLEVNIEGVFNVCKASVGKKNLRRLVDFSTSEVFGSQAYNVDEFTITPTVTIGEGRWTYAISKLAGEFIAHAYHTKYDLPTVTIRPFNIYGPNQVGVGAVHHFVKHAINNEPLVIHDDGSQIRAWCYVDDFVDCMLRTLDSEIAVGRSYNIGNPRSTVTTYNLANLIIRLAESDSELAWEEMGFSDVALRIPNIDNARKDLGYEPKVELDEGLRRTIEWYRSNASE